jgi:hypothetical protein
MARKKFQPPPTLEEMRGALGPRPRLGSSPLDRPAEPAQGREPLLSERQRQLSEQIADLKARAGAIGSQVQQVVDDLRRAFAWRPPSEAPMGRWAFVALQDEDAPRALAESGRFLGCPGPIALALSAPEGWVVATPQLYEALDGDGLCPYIAQPLAWLDPAALATEPINFERVVTG